MKAPRRLYDPSATKPETEWLGFDEAKKQLGAALMLPDEVAEALLCGLCATEAVRCCDCDGKIIDPSEEPMGTAARPHIVSEKDFREWMRDHCHALLDKAAEIRRMLRAGEKPGKRFFDDLRNRCGGWLKPGKPARGFTDRHLRRLINDLRNADI